VRLIMTSCFILALCMNARGQTSSSDSQLCAVDVRWLNTTGSVNYARSIDTAKELSFIVHLSRGSGCSSAEVSITATYLTDAQDLICSGTIRQAMNVSLPVQTFNISIRPFTQLDFVRWRNQPGVPGEQQGKRLACLGIDGTSNLGDADRQKAGWMRLTISVMPAGGGLSLTEAVFRFVP